ITSPLFTRYAPIAKLPSLWRTVAGVCNLQAAGRIAMGGERDSGGAFRREIGMKTVAARSWLETRDYRRPFVIAGGASPSATNVFVALTGEDGTVGYGEAAPMTAYSGETAEGVRHALEEFFFPLVIGADPLDLEGLH